MTGLLIGLLVSQGLWAKAYGGTGFEEPYSMVQTTDGGFAVAGETFSFGAGSNDFLIVKLAPDGSLSWAKTFGGMTDDWKPSMVQTTDGGFAVAGSTLCFGAGSSDLILLKLASDGSLTWARTYGGTSWDEVHSVIQTSDGGFAIAGETYGFAADETDVLVLKLASNGTLTWAKTFGGTGYDGAVASIIQTTDGGFALAVNTSSFSAYADFLVLKLASDGSLTWARTFRGAYNDGPESIIQTSDGGFAIAGWTESSGAGRTDFLVLKLATDGSLTWARTFGGADWDEASSVIQTSDGGFAVVGFTWSFGAGGDDFLMLKLTSDGSLIWARIFGGASRELGHSIVQTSDGGFAIAGHTQSFGAAGDFIVLKIDPNGNYPDCVQGCSPVIGTPSLTTSSPSLGAVCSPTTTSPSPTVTTPTLTVTDACPPSWNEEADLSRPVSGITCSPVPGGALFVSSGDMSIRIYAADGRLEYSGTLVKGQNRITLEAGVYLWQAGECGDAGAPAYPASFGKAVVR